MLIIGDVYNRVIAACIVYSFAAWLVSVIVMQLGHFCVEHNEL